MRAFVVEEPRSGALRALNYAPAVERIRRAGSNSAVPLRDVVKEFGPSYGSRFTSVECDPKFGIEVLAQSDTFRALPVGKVIRHDCLPHPERHEIRRGQVLIAGAGTLGENEIYGRSVLADERLAGKFLGPDTMALVFNEPLSDFALFTYAWLASPTGVDAVRSTSCGTKLLRFRQDLLTSLPVPVPDKATVAKVANSVRECIANRERFVRRLKNAHRLLDNTPEVDAAKRASATRRLGAVWSGDLRTLRAWNHVAEGGALAAVQGQSGLRIRDWVPETGVFHGLLRIRTWCKPPHGHDLFSQRDVFSLMRIPRRLRHPSGPDEAFFSPQDGILIASRGQLGTTNLFGRAELGRSLSSDAGVSQDMLRVVPDRQYLELLYAYLSHEVGQALTRTTAVGTSIPIIHTGLFLDLPVPDVSSAIAHAIRDEINAAYASRSKADVSHAAAIEIIEQEVLPQWLA